MANRVIKESIKFSEQVDSLTWFEECVFYRLLVTADDFGCFDARPVRLKNELFPLKENVTRKSVEEALERMVKVGLLCPYTVNGIPYMFFPTWERHQLVRNKRRKFPKPPDDALQQFAAARNDSQQLATTCNNLQQLAASCMPESESESISESESENIVLPLPPARAREDSPGADELVAYAANNLQAISADNMDELVSYRDSLTDEVIRYAINEACAHANRAYAYARKILNRCVESGLRTMGDVEAAKAKYAEKNHKKQASNPALNFSQRMYTDDELNSLIMNMDYTQ